MRLFARRLSKPDAADGEYPAGLAIIRRIKVTIDRYWVTSEVPMERTTDGRAEPHPEVDVDEKGG